MNEIVRDVSVPEGWDRTGLPGWCYHSEAFLELEKERVFRTHWQIACHVSDVPNAGDYIAMDVVGERALIVRAQDGQIRGFHNICRHRGSRVVAEDKGSCRNALVCPFHGWVYNLDGTLRGAARPQSFPPLDKTEFGLIPLDLEIWLGFVFIRFRPGPQASVAEIMRPFADELGAYRTADMVAAQDISTDVSPVNWKSVRDVDNEGYHVAMAHPALQDLYGASYAHDPYVDGICRASGDYNPNAGRRWSVRQYVRIAPEATGLPERLRRSWSYFMLFPNAVISVTPESVSFYQEFPLAVGQTMLRGGVYRYPDETRRQRAARYLAMRIDRETQSEDAQLTQWSNEAMTSKAFSGFFLSDLEYGVRTHHDHLRAALPVATLERAPEESRMAAANDALLGRAR